MKAEEFIIKKYNLQGMEELKGDWEWDEMLKSMNEYSEAENRELIDENKIFMILHEEVISLIGAVITPKEIGYEGIPSIGYMCDSITDQLNKLKK